MTKNALDRILRSPDDNTGGDSSTSSDATGQDSSTAQQSEQQADEGEEQTDSDEGDGEETDTNATGNEQADDQQESQQQQETDQQSQAAPIVDKQGDEKLPFNTHPRFRELIAEKNAARQEVESLKPQAEQAKVLQDFLRDNNISLQEYQTALQYLSLLRKNPTEAFNMIKPTYEQLAMYTGERLPEDLQAKVAAGTLDPNDAKLIAQAQAQQRYSQVQQQWNQQGQQLQQTDLISSTMNQVWLPSRQAVDPDLRPGTPLWEQVNLRVTAAQASWRNAQDAMAGCEKAYTESKAFMKQFQPRAAARQQKSGLQSRQTSGNGNVVMKTAEDVARAIQHGVKPNQMRYS